MKNTWFTKFLESTYAIVKMVVVWVFLQALFPNLAVFGHKSSWHFLGVWLGYWAFYRRIFPEKDADVH
jgi:hypothetical protein